MNPNAELPLADIITPNSIALWPPAIGWWLLLLLVLIALTYLIIAIKKYKKKWGYRKQALALLENDYQNWQNLKSNSNDLALNEKASIAESMMTVLKRTAMTAYPKEQVGTLYGKDWLDFLISRADTQKLKQPLTDNLKLTLSDGHYQQDWDYDLDSLYSFCCQWVKTHKTSNQKVKS
jgi:hypothetical protein